MVTASLSGISFEKKTITGKTKEVTEKKQLGASEDKPSNVPQTIKYSDNSNIADENNILTLSDIQSLGTSWEQSEQIPITCKKYNKSYYELGNGILIDGSNQNNLNGYEKEIANIINLDTSKYRITSIRWVGADTTNGKSTYRKAVVICQKKITTWQAIYKGKITLPDEDRYTATARYIATLTKTSTTEFNYKVKATATYNLIKSQATTKINFLPIVLSGGAVIIFVLLIIIIIHFIKKKKRRALGY